MSMYMTSISFGSRPAATAWSRALLYAARIVSTLPRAYVSMLVADAQRKVTV
jgi:hypothetical protein